MSPAREFVYKPDEYEAEKASNSYLMSLIAIMVGLPLPWRLRALPPRGAPQPPARFE